MSKSINQINATPGADRFTTWVDRTNEVINAISTIAVTTASNTLGSNTVGNGFVVGIFGANTLAANNLRGGNVGTVATLNVVSNLQSNAVIIVGNSTANVWTNSIYFTAVNSTAQVNVTPLGVVAGQTTINSIAVSVGNSSVNVVANASTVIVGGNASHNATTFSVGNSSVNAVVNSSALVIGGNASHNATTFSVGNSSVNLVANSSKLLIGGNAAINATTFLVGNSTVNSTVNATMVQVVNSTATVNVIPTGVVAGQTTINTIALSVGNSSVNVVANASTVVVGANAQVNSTAFQAGNSTTNLVATAIQVLVQDVSSTGKVNSTTVAVGSNVSLTTAALLIGNSSVNVVQNSSVMLIGGNLQTNSTTLQVGNSSVNAVVNSSLALFSGNLQVNSTSFLVGNSSVNAFINSSTITLSGAAVMTGNNRAAVAKNATSTFVESRINFVAGNNISFGITDDTSGGQINVVINAVATSGSAIIGGANTNIQYNFNGNFAGSDGFVFNDQTNVVTISNTLICNNYTFAQNILEMGFAVANTNATGPDQIDGWPIASYRSAEYFYSLKNDSANGYQTGRFAVLNDGTNGNMSEYAVVFSNAVLGAFSASQNATHILVRFTPTAQMSYTIKTLRSIIPV